MLAPKLWEKSPKKNEIYSVAMQPITQPKPFNYAAISGRSPQKINASP